ncbi:UvrD-helicase domain-containing protein [Alphaproteobacteria bacterium]|nr:UvrD-helicase domain-containing protein [Alphaproteobacteria bacterium]
MSLVEEKLIIPEPDFISGLNSEQKKAVMNMDGPLLVLSGAGTGKTKVLTTRLANIIHSRKASISNILCVTFTNKAAFEMKSRVEKILKQPVEGMSIGTFHSIGAKFLRKHSSLMEIKNDFTILDTEDQLRLIKQVISFLDLDPKIFVPKSFLYMIDQMKNYGLSYDEITNHEFEHKTKGNLSKVYKLYQQRLKTYNSVDFGDLILLPLKILRQNSEISDFYNKKFKYILVDEYQDTNAAQYMLLRLLSSERKNICCVGDEDQSIYGWRGAQLKNILNFENDFKGAQIIRLEQNYRSTGNILDAASSLISENKERIGKKLWTSDPTGEPVEVINLENDEMEAFFVSEKIVNLQNIGIKLSKMAILTRASFQFKDLEDRFIRENIKYKVVGGLRFYERAEIKDALAFFRLLIKSDDNLSFERIINIPKRGLGSVFLRKLNDFAKKNNLSLLDSLRKYLETEILSKGPRDNITMFLKVLDKHKEMLKNKDHFEVAGALLDDIGYTDMLKNEKTIESEGRLENLKKLVVDIKSRTTLNEFLDEVSLLTDVSNEREGTEKISIMTLHSAKGLEFDYVFLPGWEEGIFPNQRSLDENGNKGLEEERRLAYVGITRARKKLSISFVNFRKQYNYNIYRSIPSRFLSELPKKNCELKLNQCLKEKRTRKIDHIKSNEFSVGTLVKHDDFGEGKVLGINGKKLQVKFKKFEEIMSIFSDFVKKQ